VRAGRSALSSLDLDPFSTPMTPDLPKDAPLSIAAQSDEAHGEPIPAASQHDNTGCDDDDDGLAYFRSSNGRGDVGVRDLFHNFCEALPPRDTLAGNEGAIEGYKRRMDEAIQAEGKADLEQYGKLLRTPRPDLERKGLLLTGLSMESHCLQGDVIKVTVPRGGALPTHHQFTPRQTVTVLLSLDSEVVAPAAESHAGMADKAAADGAAVERGRERADGSSPSDGGESPTRVSSMVHQRQDKTPQVSENSTQALLLESMGLRKAFIASVQSVRKDEIVITTRVNYAPAMVEEAGAGKWAIIEGRASPQRASPGSGRTRLSPEAAPYRRCAPSWRSRKGRGSTAPSWRSSRWLRAAP